MSFRPETGSRYLDRPRLLGRLPTEPGFVVWLEAPYGYGKSVLASQWVDELEQDGWQVVWLSAGERDLRRTVSQGLGLPAESPMRLVLDTLWSDRTVLVLEDLENLGDHEELVPLLRDPRGLVLMASRGPLRSSELPRLLTAGRLTHLRSDKLAFTRDEIDSLMHDPQVTDELWRQSGGWPLPVHFAALTGELPDSSQVVSGLKASLSAGEWQEVLLLAAVSDLPAEAGTEHTERLASNGFVQHGAAGYRLHTMAAAAILDNHAADSLKALHAAAGRLPPLTYGEALEQLGDHEALNGLLEQPQLQLSRQAPHTVLRWDSLAAGTASAARHVSAGMANTVLSRHSEAVNRIMQALDVGGMDADEELFARNQLVWPLAHTDPVAAARLVEQSEQLLAEVDQELAGRFLMNSSYVDFVAGDHQAAMTRLQRALETLPVTSAYRTGCHINLALNRWDSLGDYDGRLAAQKGTLEEVWRLHPSDAPGQCRDIAMLHAWAGDEAAARDYLYAALQGERASPVVGLEVRAALAALDRDADVFPELLAQARMWNRAVTLDLIAMHAIQTVPDEAEYYYAQVPEPVLATAAYARLHPDPVEALRLLDEALVVETDRSFRLYLLAARYSVSRSGADLSAFLAESNAGARLLPGHVPLSALPASRPDLARHYPIETVIDSGWKDAIRLRLEELPNLHIDVLGQLRVHFGGRVLDINERQLQVLLLLLLGFSREEAAESIWPEADRAQQRNNYSVQLSTLRKVLEPWGGGRFLVDDRLDNVSGDYVELMAALDRNDHAALHGIYREPFAPGIHLSVLDEHRNWLHSRVVSALRAAANEGDAGASSYLIRILELDPLNEDVLRQLLKELLARGRQGDAQRYYREFASRLRADTGLEPDAATTVLLS